MPFTLRQLEVFVAVAKDGSATRAGARLHLTQPAVSMALAGLEAELGEPLFDRLPRRLVLNGRGRALLPEAAALLARAAELEASFWSEDAPVGQLRVGASSTVGNYLLPAPLAAFARAHPQASVTLEVDNTDGIVARLRRLEVDVAFVEGPVRDPALEVAPWRKDRLAVFAAPSHPLAGRRRVGLEALARARWILREPGSGTREVFEQAVAGRLPRLDVALELGHTEAVKRAVTSGAGLGCLSRLALEDGVALGRLVELSTPELTLDRDLLLVSHPRHHRTRLARAFLEAVAGPGATGAPGGAAGPAPSS